MVGRDDYALFYRTACEIFEAGFEFINKTDDNYYFMNVAAVKFLKHLNTTEMLMASELELNYVESGYIYYDTSSVIALLRVSYENLVTIAYHYFCDELNKDHLDWYKLLGYKNRAKNKIIVKTPELDAKIKEEQQIINELSARLELNGFKASKKNEWKPCGWYELGQKLDIPTFVCDKYSFWSSHTHTGFDSLMQVNTSHQSLPTEEIERNKINYLFMCSVLVYFIDGYVRILEKLGYPYISDIDLNDVKGFLLFMNAFPR
ncbi:DUF5677 domain-containing protein [Shewanella scandinavica]|uniref:DUF5677 domain-containing protein n=1 Tax=Shewanella scandinavica TaxID=3063538 RepID=UPI00306EA30F